MTLEPNHQNPQSLAPAQPPLPNRKRRKNNFLLIVAGSLTLHAALYFLALQVPAPLLPKRDQLIEIDLRHYKPTVALKPTPEKPVVLPKPKPQPRIKSAALKQTTPPHQKAEVPQPTQAPDAKPTAAPQPTTEAKPTAEPQPTAVPQPTAAPQPTAVPVKMPQNKIVPVPKLPPTVPTKREHPTRVAEAPSTHPIPLPSSSAPKLHGEPKPADEAGTPNGSQTHPLPGKPSPRLARNAPDFGGRGTAQGGTNNNAPVPLPKGEREGRPDAESRNHDDSHLMGARPANGLPGYGSRNNGGSPQGHNNELAGTDGAGGARVAKAAPRHGSGGGAERFAGLLPTFKSDFTVDTKHGRGPGAGGGEGGRHGGGTGREVGDGAGFGDRGLPRSAFTIQPGSGLGSGSGGSTGGPRGNGNGGETAGNGGAGGYRGGRGNSYAGNGDGSGGGHHMRYAGVPKGDPFGASTGGNPHGGGGHSHGPGGPGQGARIARHFGAGDGSGSGNGHGPGTGDGDGFRRGGGNPGAGGLDGTGNRAGQRSGNGNGGGGHGRGGEGGTGETAGNGDGDTAGSGYSRGHHRGGGPIRIARRGGDDAILGRGLMRNNGESGIDAYYYEDADLSSRGLETKVYELEQSGKKVSDWPVIPIDWPTETKLKRHQTDQIIDFDWHGDAPAPGVRGSFFSVKWSGKIFVPKEDDYRFQFENLDDGGKLILDGQTIIKIWKVQKSSPSTDQSYHLTRGPHTIEIHYVQGPPTAASITLKWMSSSFPWETVGAYHAPQ